MEGGHFFISPRDVVFRRRALDPSTGVHQLAILADVVTKGLQNLVIRLAMPLPMNELRVRVLVQLLDAVGQSLLDLGVHVHQLLHRRLLCTQGCPRTWASGFLPKRRRTYDLRLVGLGELSSAPESHNRFSHFGGSPEFQYEGKLNILFQDELGEEGRCIVIASSILKYTVSREHSRDCFRAYPLQ